MPSAARSWPESDRSHAGGQESTARWLPLGLTLNLAEASPSAARVKARVGVSVRLGVERQHLHLHLHHHARPPKHHHPASARPPRCTLLPSSTRDPAAHTRPRRRRRRTVAPFQSTSARIRGTLGRKHRRQNTRRTRSQAIPCIRRLVPRPLLIRPHRLTLQIIRRRACMLKQARTSRFLNQPRASPRCPSQSRRDMALFYWLHTLSALFASSLFILCFLIKLLHLFCTGVTAVCAKSTDEMQVTAIVFLASVSAMLVSDCVAPHMPCRNGLYSPPRIEIMANAYRSSQTRSALALLQPVSRLSKRSRHRHRIRSSASNLHSAQCTRPVGDLWAATTKAHPGRAREPQCSESELTTQSVSHLTQRRTEERSEE